MNSDYTAEARALPRGRLIATCLALLAAMPAVLFGGSQDPTEREAPRILVPGQDCSECHTEEVAGKRVHKPVRDESCELCHLTPDPTKHFFVDPVDQAEVCLECHQLPERLGFHEPVADGKCLDCHQPHSSDHRYLLRNQDQRALCVSCHEPQTGVSHEHVHGPVAMGSCTICHLPHSSRNPKLLRMPVQDACTDCHMEMGQDLAAAASVHQPVSEDCSQCHDPHASNEIFQLSNEPRALCLDCHQPMLDAFGERREVHRALVSEDACMTCHEVHFSGLPRLLKAPVRDLCMECHEHAIEATEDTPGTIAMGEKLANSAHLHGPIREGNCVACHDPHGSTHFDLLRDPYPKRFYAPFKKERYDLCFRCHDPVGFTEAATETATGFRNGERNLHFVHVNRDKKGRTCRACHDTHASNNPKHMTDSVPFGNWEIPIEFQISAAGGSCAPGCHSPKSYVNDGGRPAINPTKEDQVNTWGD